MENPNTKDLISMPDLGSTKLPTSLLTKHYSSGFKFGKRFTFIYYSSPNHTTYGRQKK